MLEFKNGETETKPIPPDDTDDEEDKAPPPAALASVAQSKSFWGTLVGAVTPKSK